MKEKGRQGKKNGSEKKTAEIEGGREKTAAKRKLEKKNGSVIFKLVVRNLRARANIR